MLNDLSRFTRLTTFVQAVSGGLLVGLPLAALVGGVDGLSVAVGVVLVLALGSVVAWACYYVTAVRRANDRLLDSAAATAAEIGTGGWGAGPAVPGRVVRTRPDRKGRPTVVLGFAPGPVRADLVVVLTVLPLGAPARRVAALAPAALAGALARDSHHAVVLDPNRPEAGVLDGRPTGVDRDRFARDPRWHQEPLPTDRTVVGGYLPLAGIAVLGLAVGLAVSTAISVLVNALS